MKRAIALLQILGLLFWNVPFLNTVAVARADDSDIFGSNIAPNVMILFDNSGSMSDTVPASGYTSSTTYNTPLTYTTAKVYRKYTKGKDCKPSSAPCYKVYANTISDVTSSAARSALTSSGHWSGSISGSNVDLYAGNYLNYLACTSCATNQPKITVAKRVLTNLINNVDGVRFGVMKFRYTPTLGAAMVAPVGSDKNTIITAVNALTADLTTPLGEQLRDAGNYFKGTYSGYSSPIQYSCQPNFVILMTDGIQNGSVDVRTEATNRYTQDHSNTYAGNQNVIVHTIGFGLSAADIAAGGTQNLKDAAQNGGGSFYTAGSETQLETALEDAISQIMAATFSFATPVIPTTGTSGSARAYLASFQSNPSRPFWQGNLKAYNRDANGLIPVDASGLPTGTPAWDAGQQLSAQSASSRTIYTLVSGARQTFTTSNSAITTTLLDAADSTEKNKIINFVRGTPDINDEDTDGNTAEERPWKLGDIFHSTPVLISPPFQASADSSYNAFKTAQASRTTVLIAGANDGMLHAFRESDGAELWGFIPPDLLDQLKDLTAVSGEHEYAVDSSPIAADVKIGGSWKTIVVFGQRRGGTNYYALDITDTTNPAYLWTFNDSNLGETWSEPAIGKVKMSDGTDKWVAFVGGGFDSTNANYTSGNHTSEAFFVIDLSNGNKLWEYYNATGATDDRQYMNFSLPAAPTAVDLNGDGYVDKVYIGDVGGQVWKFDVAPSGGATVSGGLVINWTGKRLFAAAASQTNPPAAGEFYPAQAIYVPPTLSYDTVGNLWVYFGTGDRFHPNNTSSNRFYGIKDNTSMTNGSVLTESALTNVTSGTGTVTQGWYIVLASNEKVLAASDVFNKAVFFTTFTPVTAAVCNGGGGDAKLYAVNLTTGDAAVDLTTGTALSVGQSALAAAKAIGTGIPSRPIVIINQSGNMGSPHVITGTTNQQISNTQIPQVGLRRLVGWREVF
jgi:type IV pilus assembly protein PilY1